MLAHSIDWIGNNKVLVPQDGRRDAAAALPRLRPQDRARRHRRRATCSGMLFERTRTPIERWHRSLLAEARAARLRRGRRRAAVRAPGAVPDRRRRRRVRPPRAQLLHLRPDLVGVRAVRARAPPTTPARSASCRAQVVSAQVEAARSRRLLRAAGRAGMATARRCIGEHAALSFAELDRAADALGRARCAPAGRGPGAHVGLLGGQPAGVARGRLRRLARRRHVWCRSRPSSPRASSADIVADADVDTLIVQPRLRSHDYLALIDELPPPCGRAQIVARLARRTRRRADHAASSPERSIRESIACILYTSGTTGRAKGRHAAATARFSRPSRRPAQRTGLTPDDALLSTLPLFWVAGLVIRALPTLAAGCALILLETLHDRRGRSTALRRRPADRAAPAAAAGRTAPRPSATSIRLCWRRCASGGGRVDWFAPHLDPHRCA